MPYVSNLIDDSQLIFVIGVGKFNSAEELELWRDQLREGRIFNEYDLLVDLSRSKALDHPDGGVEVERSVSRLPQRQPEDRHYPQLHKEFRETLVMLN